MPKLIGLTSFIEEGRNKINQAYIDAFTVDGFCPIVIPTYKRLNDTELLSVDERIASFAAEIALRLDCLVLTGGQDVNPISYSEENVSSSRTSYLRDIIEIELLKAFMRNNKPIMGICRGLQLIWNVLEYNYNKKQAESKDRIYRFSQDISEKESHVYSDVARNEPCHQLILRGGLQEHFASRIISVNSFHHQGVFINEDGTNSKGKTSTERRENLEKSFAHLKSSMNIEVLAHTSTIIEAFETGNTFAVQWHPEEFKNSGTIQYFLKRSKWL